MAATGLIDRHVTFVEALRGAGLPVSLVESLDAARAMATVDMLDREQLRAAYAATSVKHAAHRATFDRLFDLWWPPAVGEPESARGSGVDGDAEGELEEVDPADLDAMRQAMRDALREVLLTGDDEAIRRLAREAVSGFGRADTQPGRQSWFTYRVLRAMSPETLMASLREAGLAGPEGGGLHGGRGCGGGWSGPPPVRSGADLPRRPRGRCCPSGSVSSKRPSRGRYAAGSPRTAVSSRSPRPP